MIDTINSHINEKREDYIELLTKYVSQQSISSDPIETPKCANLLKKIMEDVGIKTQLFETKGQPIVFGELNTSKPDAKTVLFYGHYDVQPVEPLEEWISNPFKPEIRNGRIYGRGVADNKGQHLAHILAISSYLQTVGELPINIKFIMEGQEEIGSPNLSEFVMEHKELLKADIVYISDGSVHESGVQRVSFGNRGVINFSITIETSNKDNHSGSKGGVISNAGWELNHLLSTMLDEEGNVLINGFYEDIKYPTAYEEGLIESLPFNKEELAKTFGVEKIYYDKKDYFNNLLFKPTLTINAFECGNSEVSKTIVPGKAVVKMDIRLVVNQDPDKTFERVVEHVNRQNVKGKITIRREGSSMFPAKSVPEHPLFKEILKSIEKTVGCSPIIIPITGGSLPNYVWTKLLNTNFILVPYANADSTNHAPNENLDLEYFLQGIKITAGVIHDLAN